MAVVHATQRPRLPIWVVVAAGGTITAIALGVRSTFGLFIGPIAEGIGSDLGSISLAVAIQNLIWGFSQPLAGAASDRFGAAWTLAFGGLLYGVAMLLMSTAESAGMIVFSGGFLAGIALGAASFAVVLSAVGRMAPPEKRSMMLGVVSAVGSLGQFVLIPVARWMLDNGSWERTAVAMTLILIPIIVLAPLLRSIVITAGPDTAAHHVPATSRTLRQELRRASHSRSYVLLNAAFFVCGFHVTFIGIHLAGYVEGVGLSATTAATALALIGLFNVFGSLAAGFLGQRHAFTKILAGIYGLRAVVIAIYVIVPVTAASTIIFGMTIGMLWLATVPPTAGIVTNLLGPANAGAMFGIVFLSHQLGSFTGAWLGGELADATNSYLIMWWLSVALGVCAMLLHLMIDETPVPDPPDSAFGLAVAPAALAAVVMVAGLAGAIASSQPVEASSAARPAMPAFYCVLGPPFHGN